MATLSVSFGNGWSGRSRKAVPNTVKSGTPFSQRWCRVGARDGFNGHAMSNFVCGSWTKERPGGSASEFDVPGDRKGWRSCFLFSLLSHCVSHKSRSHGGGLVSSFVARTERQKGARQVCDVKALGGLWLCGADGQKYTRWHGALPTTWRRVAATLWYVGDVCVDASR